MLYHPGRRGLAASRGKRPRIRGVLPDGFGAAPGIFPAELGLRMSVVSQLARRILVVAADENFSGTIGRILCRCGYTIDRVASGEAAISALDQHGYDLVLSEVALPGVC